MYGVAVDRYARGINGFTNTVRVFERPYKGTRQYMTSTRKYIIPCIYISCCEYPHTHLVSSFWSQWEMIPIELTTTIDIQKYIH